MGDFIAGIKYLIAGFDLIIKPGIRLYVLVPMLINSMLFTAAIVYGTHLLNDFIEAWLNGWWEWLRWLLWPVFVIVALTVIFFCFSIFANLIAAPFNGFLAAAVETHITGIVQSETGGLSRLPVEVKKALTSEFKKFTYFAVRAVPLLILFFIPILQLAAPFLWFLFGAWVLTLEYIDFPMGNHGLIFPEQRQIMSTKRHLAFGFGIGALVLTLIPVVNFIAIPVAVCGATKLWVEKIHTS